MRRYLIFLITVFAVMPACGELNDASQLGLLTRSSGLASDAVNKTMTDHAGRVWAATGNGVSMYNGRRLRNYRLQADKMRALSVLDIAETADHSIFAATGHGLYCKRYGSDSFVRVAPEVEHCENLLGVDGRLYIGSKAGLYIYPNFDAKNYFQRFLPFPKKLTH